MEMLGKNILIVLIVFLSFLCFVSVADASTIVKEASIYESYEYYADINAECEAIFGDPENEQYPAYWMQFILNIMRYAGIVALLVLSTFDFIKALVQNDKDAVKKAAMSSGKRFIYCVLLFFLPIIVDFIMRLFGAYGTCGIG